MEALFTLVIIFFVIYFWVQYSKKKIEEEEEMKKRKEEMQRENKRLQKEEEKRKKEELERQIAIALKNKFKQMLIKCKLLDEKDYYSEHGEYLHDDDINEFLYSIVFKSLLPLGDWLNKKEELEVYLNKKIIDIVQDPKDKQIIKLVMSKKSLPEKIAFNDNFIDTENNILNIGVGYYGIVGHDLEKYPHSFIAGDTGSGKSNIMKCLIHQALVKGYDVLLIDFKRGVSFSVFENVNIYYRYETVVKMLDDMVEETNKRLDLFREKKVDNLKDYNKIAEKELKRKIIFIDELAELLNTSDKKISKSLYANIETLTRISRSAGINLIMGIQRPDSTVITGQIKSNVSFRVCGHFPDKEPSVIMLGSPIASSLPVEPKGRYC